MSVLLGSYRNRIVPAKNSLTRPKWMVVPLNQIVREGRRVCTPRSGSCVRFRRIVPVTLVDVAGLVPSTPVAEDVEIEFLV